MSPRHDAVRVAVIADTIGGPGGMGRYARELVAALARRDDVELWVVAPGDARERVAGLPASRPVRLVPLPGRGQVLDAAWERMRLGSVLEGAGVDVVHGTKHLLPRTGRPTVLTVHDLTVLTRPAEAGLVRRLLLPARYRSALRQATALLAVSGATRDRLADFDPRWGAKAEAVPNGASTDLRLVEPEPVPDLVDAPFALAVGDLSPRKNVELLADIWGSVHRRTGVRLALAGAGGLKDPALARRLAGMEEEGLVRRLGPVPGRELRWCYEHCRALLFPSLEEGFGFPVIEARLFGAPVVASTDPALVEAAAGTAVHVDAADREAWEEAVVEVVSRGRADRGTAAPPGGGDRPRTDGPGAMPTWDDHAEGAVRLYRRVLGARDHAPRAASEVSVP